MTNGTRLGDATSTSLLAINFIERTLNLSNFDRLVTSDRSDDDWQAFKSLMRSEWFSRRWVIQEVAFARRATLHCGEDTFEWSDFAEAVSNLETVNAEILIKATNLMKLDLELSHMDQFISEIPLLAATRLFKATNDIVRKSDDGKILEKVLPLEVLIHEFTAFRASRAHDVIYAILALARGIRPLPRRSTSSTDTISPTSQQILERTASAEKVTQNLMSAARMFQQSVNSKASFHVDYSTPFFDLCKELLNFTIKDSKSIDILCRPWVPDKDDGKEIKDLPSWLLTTRHSAFSIDGRGSFIRVNGDSLVGNPRQEKRNYDASGQRPVGAAFRFGNYIEAASLFVGGFVIDYIKVGYEVCRKRVISKEWLSAGGWHDVSATPPEKFWRTLVADRGPNGSNCPKAYPRACKAMIPKGPLGNISISK